MGNQREIKQLAPVRRNGFAVPVSSTDAIMMQAVLSRHDIGHFYTYLLYPGDDGLIPSMDGDPTELGTLTQHHFAIQSGGKMRCGYQNFVSHLFDVAPYIPDSMFLVGDEEDYIDSFIFTDGRLEYTRIHSGFWIPLEDFISERFPIHHD